MSHHLMSGEVDLITVRQHWSVVVPGLVGCLLVLATGLAGLIVVPSAVFKRDISGIKNGVEAALVVVVLLAIGWRLVQWRATSYAVTNRRVILNRGVVSRITESIALDRVQDTTMRRPLGDRLIGTANIEIESAGRDGVEVLHRVPHAEHVYATLLQAIETHRGQAYSVAPPPPPGL